MESEEVMTIQDRAAKFVKAGGYVKINANTTAEMATLIGDQSAEIARLTARLAEATDAVKPLCALGGGPELQAYCDLEDDVVVYKSGAYAITAGDVRNAREVVAKILGEPVSITHSRRRPSVLEQENIDLEKRAEAAEARLAEVEPSGKILDALRNGLADDVVKATERAEAAEAQVKALVEADAQRVRDICRLTDERDAARERVEVLDGLLQECADDLEVYVKAEWPNRGQYPHQMVKFERDIEPVRKARAALAGEPVDGRG
jgi:hypothetical protein